MHGSEVSPSMMLVDGWLADDIDGLIAAQAWEEVAAEIELLQYILALL